LRTGLIQYIILNWGKVHVYGAMIKLPVAPSRYYPEALSATCTSTGIAAKQWGGISSLELIYHRVSCSTEIACNPYYSQYDMRRQRMRQVEV